MKSILSLISAAAVATPLMAADIREIELRRLFEPTTSELQAERSGLIFIYEGLTDRDVEQAMEAEFDRVEHMMFIRLKKTDEKGEVQKDPETGEAAVHDDGC
jgi:hypothetical protein